MDAEPNVRKDKSGSVDSIMDDREYHALCT
jgi:hypothetical protein